MLSTVMRNGVDHKVTNSSDYCDPDTTTRQTYQEDSRCYSSRHRFCVAAAMKDLACSDPGGGFCRSSLKINMMHLIHVSTLVWGMGGYTLAALRNNFYKDESRGLIVTLNAHCSTLRPGWKARLCKIECGRVGWEQTQCTNLR